MKRQDCPLTRAATTAAGRCKDYREAASRSTPKRSINTGSLGIPASATAIDFADAAHPGETRVQVTIEARPAFRWVEYLHSQGEPLVTGRCSRQRLPARQPAEGPPHNVDRDELQTPAEASNDVRGGVRQAGFVIR